MTSATATRALTVRDVAQPELRDDASGPLDRHLRGVVVATGDRNSLDDISQHALDGQIRAALDGVLDRDLVSVLGAAWQVSRRFQSAAAATAAQPGTRQIIRLASQTCSHSTTPTIVLRLDGVPVGTVGVTITVELTFADLAVAVAAGAIVAFEFGRCDIAVTIEAAEPMPPLLQRSMTLTSNVELPVPRPIPIPRRH